MQLRIDKQLKTQASEALAKGGLSMSDAMSLFLQRVVAEGSFPAELKVPNAETREAMEEARAKMAAWQRERDEA